MLFATAVNLKLIMDMPERVCPIVYSFILCQICFHNSIFVQYHDILVKRNVMCVIGIR